LVLGLIGALALAACGADADEETAVPQPTATPSLTPTPTPLPPTPTIAPTATPAPAQAVSATPGGGSLVTAQNADGSLLVVDGEIGYQLIVPAGWELVDLSGATEGEMLEMAATEYPERGDLIVAYTNSGLDTRLSAYGESPNPAVSDYPPAIIVAVDTRYAALPLGVTVQLAAQVLPTMIQGAEVLSSETTQAASGLPIGIIETRLPLTDEDGQAIDVYQRSVLFKSGPYLVVVYLAADEQLREEVQPVFTQIIDSVSLAGG
jgi:hypothetical protein